MRQLTNELSTFPLILYFWADVFSQPGLMNLSVIQTERVSLFRKYRLILQYFKHYSQIVYLGRTEHIMDTLNPIWHKKFILDYKFEVKFYIIYFVKAIFKQRSSNL